MLSGVHYLTRWCPDVWVRVRAALIIQIPVASLQSHFLPGMSEMSSFKISTAWMLTLNPKPPYGLVYHRIVPVRGNAIELPDILRVYRLAPMTLLPSSPHCCSPKMVACLLNHLLLIVAWGFCQDFDLNLASGVICLCSEEALQH